jgi:hypothetical protein
VSKMRAVPAVNTDRFNNFFMIKLFFN